MGRTPSAAAVFVPAFLPPRGASPAAEDAVVVVAGDGSILAGGDAETGAPAEASGLVAPTALRDGDGTPLYLGALDGRSVWVARASEPGDGAASGRRFVSPRSLFTSLDEGPLAAVGQAMAVAEWDAMHGFCGRCATPTVPSTKERVRACPACAATFHPRVAPAVIVLVEREGRILLARGPHFPPGMFGAIAGFVETGESLEQAVAREVREEVGIGIRDVRYFGSQPWPFGRSLMVGFHAKHADGEVRPDGQEIVEADFYARDALPGLPPPASIARKLVDAFLAITAMGMIVLMAACSGSGSSSADPDACVDAGAEEASNPCSDGGRCAAEGELCAGVGGIRCSAGLVCVGDNSGNVSDASGTCRKRC